MKPDIIPGGGATPEDTGQITRIENLSIGFTPEALAKRVNRALSGVDLTGIEGNAFGFSFSLILIGSGFRLQSPPRGEPWDPPEKFVPDVFAQVSVPNEISPTRQVIWGDHSTIWKPRDEISNGQKISMVLDELLCRIEQGTQTERDMPRPELRLNDGVSDPA